MGALGKLLHYVAQVTGDLHLTRFRGKLAEYSPEAEQAAMTIIEEMLQQGRQEGRQEGLHEGKQEMLLSLLQEKFGELSDEAVRRVKGASDEEVNRLSKRLLTADSLAAVFGG